MYCILEHFCCDFNFILNTIRHVKLIYCMTWDITHIRHVKLIYCMTWDIPHIRHVKLIYCMTWDITHIRNVKLIYCMTWDITHIRHLILVGCFQFLEHHVKYHKQTNVSIKALNAHLFSLVANDIWRVKNTLYFQHERVLSWNVWSL